MALLNILVRAASPWWELPHECARIMENGREQDLTASVSDAELYRETEGGRERGRVLI